MSGCPPLSSQLFEETPMRSNGLKLRTVSAACMVEAGRLPPGDHSDSICVGNLQPDLVLARDLSWPPEIWICVARSPTTCPGVRRSARSYLRKPPCGALG
jgi:hypothetical protein